MSDVRFGSYRLVELVGQGGMAEVWRAVKEGLGGFARTVALKRMRPELADQPELVARFLNEGRLAARLHHANIVDVYELGEHDGWLYLEMEYVEGRDLDAVVREQSRQRRLSPGMAAFVVREVCRALEHIHGQREGDRSLEMIHRDVTPNNVMLAWDGSVRLVDFGIARALGLEGAPHTRTGVVVGKSWYLSPEQLRGEALDGRSDLFSAGIVLHEALTGRRLFKAESAAESARKILEGEILPPSRDNREVPRALDAICARALARRQDERWASAAELGAALDQVLATLRYGREDLHRTLAELFGRGAPAAGRGGERRRRTGVWVLAAVGTAVLAVGGAALWYRRAPSAHANATATANGAGTGTGVGARAGTDNGTGNGTDDGIGNGTDDGTGNGTDDGNGNGTAAASGKSRAGLRAPVREGGKLPARKHGAPTRPESVRRPVVDLRHSDGIGGGDLLDPYHR
jgi:tRNA A-37 threonylcarbamoyl transferase component Bud32